MNGLIRCIEGINMIKSNGPVRPPVHRSVTKLIGKMGMPEGYVTIILNWRIRMTINIKKNIISPIGVLGGIGVYWGNLRNHTLHWFWPNMLPLKDYPSLNNIVGDVILVFFLEVWHMVLRGLVESFMSILFAVGVPRDITTSMLTTYIIRELVDCHFYILIHI